MFEKEDQQLAKMKEQYEQIEIPSNIDDFIRAGVKKVGKKKRDYFKWGSLAVTVACIVFITSIQVSSTFADFAKNIPGFEGIVELISHNKGLQTAVKNDYIQKVNVTDKHGGIRFTVDSIIVDENGMDVFYIIESDKRIEDVQYNEMYFFVRDSSWSMIDLNSNYTLINSPLLPNNPTTGRLQISFNDLQYIPDEITFSLFIKSKPLITKEAFTLPIKIDRKKFNAFSKEYMVNKAISVEGQKIYVRRIEVFATRIALEVSFPTENTYKIFMMENMKLVDENGNVFNPIQDGTSATWGDSTGDSKTFFFQSNYFEKSKELYLEFSSVRALPKDKLEIVADMDKKIILKAPDDRVEVAKETFGLEDPKQGTSLAFNVRYDKKDKGTSGFEIFDYKVKDATGKIIKSNGSFQGGMSDGVVGIEGIYLKDKHYVNPLTLTIIDYPNYLHGNNSLRLK